ncbi:MAG TPA: multicopper oxidase domain-containing protein [Gaiellaceae bacterium]|nr:multicopper oxidase domain-containing protein [Gaiellaceae bacterium]
MTGPEDETMSATHTSTRLDFLKATGFGALGALAAGGAVRGGLLSPLLGDRAHAATTDLALAATDGYVTMPGRESDPIYVFGFVPVDGTLSVSELIATYKGHVKISSPHIDALQDDDLRVTVTNLGLLQRPDLTDSHTLHWHGFDIPSPLYDGVPELSIAVPIGKQVTYFYRPHREGTYMYHCHFEDVEHVQMGMTGIVFVRPKQDGTSIGGFTKFAYNDGDGSTGYHRHFAILLNEIWSNFHDGDRDIQETIPTDYDPQWFTLNGRCYPQTILPNDEDAVAAGRPDLRIATTNTTDGTTGYSQPNSSLIQANGGERVLLRLASLGYQQHAMQLPGIPMHVVGQDASLLRRGAVDTSYWTNTLYIGPGEARDVLFDAPPYDAANPSGSDGRGNYNVYYLKNRDWRRLSNNGLPGPGGMMTEVRVYQNPLPPQTKVSETFV